MPDDPIFPSRDIGSSRDVSRAPALIMMHPRVEMLATTALSENPDNARTHTPRQITQLAAAIEQFGWLVPIVCDASLMILAGHARWLAANKLHLREVPVIRAEHLSDIDKRAFALGENRLAELSGWDEKQLRKELDAIFDAGIDLETVGFSTADLSFQLVTPTTENGPSDGFVLADSAICRPGDLWVTGPHRLYCGNSLEAESYERVLPGQLANMVFADPPYNVPIAGFVRGRDGAKGKWRQFAMASGEMTSSEFTAFLRMTFRNCVRFSTSGSIHYHCMDWRHIREILDAADGVYAQFKQLIVFDKLIGGQGSFYRNQHELIFTFKSGTAKHTNNFGLGETGRYRTNIWSYPSPARTGEKDESSAHATPKPVSLVVDAIRDCSNRGDVILDPFAGSGTTLIAAHKVGRVGVGIEIDLLYVDLALKRLAAATGFEPILDGDGRSFAEIAAVRQTEQEG